MTIKIIRAALASFASQLGFVKSGASLRRDLDDLVQILELQKSSYGPQYYLNLGFGFREISPNLPASWRECHIKARVDVIIESGTDLASLLDLDHAVDDDRRGIMLEDILNRELRPFLLKYSQLEAFRGAGESNWLQVSAVTGQARKLIDRRD